MINTVGLKIKEYLDQHGVKYSYLSRLTGIPMNLLSLTLNGKRRMSVEEYFTICKALDAYECVDNSVTFVQYQAGAMGGNYQKANKIVYFTLPLGKGSCDLWEQSKKRIHRIGQNRPCFYYYLLVKGSFEERNLAALQEGKPWKWYR